MKTEFDFGYEIDDKIIYKEIDERGISYDN